MEFNRLRSFSAATTEEKRREAEEQRDAKRVDDMAALAKLKYLKSRQEAAKAVSVDTMLEMVHRPKEEEERKQAEEDAALARSIYAKRKEEVVRRLSDEDLGDWYWEDLSPTSLTSKKPKLEQGQSGNPTDALITGTVALTDELANAKPADELAKAKSPIKDKAAASASSNARKPTLNSPIVRVIAKKKQIPASVDNTKTGDEGKEVKQDAARGPSSLESLRQLYGDSEDDD